MVARRAERIVRDALEFQAAVAVIGPRQVGKTTLARAIGDELNAVYVDLEDRVDREKLEEPRMFLERYEDRLVILDEIHRVPNLFNDLRGTIDRGRRKGLRTGRFLVLGSASVDVLRQSSETLAGRIAYVDLGPLDILEIEPGMDPLVELWVRGGYPDSFLAQSSATSFKLRQHFIRTYLERDVAAFGPRLPAAALERLWTMLAHSQGGILNASRLASALGTSYQTVTRYIDVLAGLLLVRRLPPLLANVGKRLVKSPKVYVRDSGLVHALLSIDDFETLAGHPVIGQSWEGLVIENLLAAAPERTLASYYRTAAGAEADLVLEFPDGRRWAIEAKRSLAPSLTKGFHNARKDLSPERSFVVYPGDERYSRTSEVEVIGLRELAAELAGVAS
ncbi:MAG: ATP-binding protein [Acidobacteriia bacterium]|nr:ATP-binding protein [Terriglobia bacterium]MYG02304.1 ATP-binding protein [Terriglobia bacterium]MYK10531.1 ATP-binding protein [Terriglobia bacterium]